MKTLFILLLTIASFSWQAYAAQNINDWGPATNDFLISIGLKNGVHEVTNGQPCILSIRFKNVSKSKTVDVLKLLWADGDGTYSFTVLNPSGKDISPIPIEPSGGSGGVIEVTPGQTRGVEFNLSAVCKIRTIGNYRVIAKKEVWSNDGKSFQVVSNPLEITVTN